MPTYEYECPKCELIHDVIKTMARSNDTELCPDCEVAMLHVFITPRNVNTSACQFQSHYNYGLGKEFTNKRQISEELSRIKGETGKDIVEVGTDKLQSVKKKYKKYTID